jgi:hypothetical protein
MNQLARKLPLKSITLLLIALLFIPYAGMAQGSKSVSGLTVPITGTFTDALGGVGHFVGSLKIQRFGLQGGQIVAVGTLTGTLTDSVGTVLGTVVKTATLALNSALTQASCEILHLELGPLDLNLLGLTVHLDKIVLDISAQPGSGNLLGNLLCAVANLLNGGGALSSIVDLLNQILNAL